MTNVTDFQDEGVSLSGLWLIYSRLIYHQCHMNHQAPNILQICKYFAGFDLVNSKIYPATEAIVPLDLCSSHPTNFPIPSWLTGISWPPQ